MHGWARGSTTEQFRVTFNYQQKAPKYGPDVNVAQPWLEAGWNVGVFYWNQFSDEHVVNHAEAKIWSPNGPQGMRWRSFDGSYHQGPKKSAAQLFYEEYKKCLADYQGGKIRIVGHSLGNQMAAEYSNLTVKKMTVVKEVVTKQIRDSYGAGKKITGLKLIKRQARKDYQPLGTFYPLQLETGMRRMISSGSKKR